MEEESSFTEAELAARARVAPELVGWLVELGILRPGDGPAPYGLATCGGCGWWTPAPRPGCPWRGSGRRSPRGGCRWPSWICCRSPAEPLTELTYAQLCGELGLPLELVRRVHEASGLGRPQPDDPIHPLDRDLLGSAQLGRMLGLDDGVMIRIARVYGENLRRIAQAEPEFYHDHVEGPLLASGMDERQMRETASQMSDQLAEVVRRMLVALYARHQERYTTDHLVAHIEAQVTERRPRQPPAMCFLDLAGYTRLAEERGDRAAATAWPPTSTCPDPRGTSGAAAPGRPRP